MEVDRKMIKALSADTRLDILKSLKQRRKMPSELSKELKLAGSTVVEHLRKLEEAGLVEKQERGEKWIYYDLTDKGKGLVEPKMTMQFILMLCLGVLFIFTGLTNATTYNLFQETIRTKLQTPIIEIGGQSATVGTASASDLINESTKAIIKNITQNLTENVTIIQHTLQQTNWMAVLIVLIGLFLAIYGLYRIFKK